MDRSVGKIIKVLAWILLGFMVVVGFVVLIAGEYTYTFGGSYVRSSGFFGALMVWIAGFISFVFTYAAGAVVSFQYTIMSSMQQVETLREHSASMEASLRELVAQNGRLEKRLLEIVAKDEKEEK